MSARADHPDEAARDEVDDESSIASAIERARAARAELTELRQRREAAIRRADDAMKTLRGGAPVDPKVDRVQNAIAAIDRVTRVPEKK